MRELRCPAARRTEAFTLVEVVLSICIAGLLLGGIISAYVQTSYRAEWSGYSLAAQALAIQQLEQARAAVWDGNQCQFTNLVKKTADILDLPISGTNIVWATNYATVTNISLSGVPVSFYMVRVDTAWPFRWRGKVTYYTNSIADYYSPDLYAQ